MSRSNLVETGVLRVPRGTARALWDMGSPCLTCPTGNSCVCLRVPRIPGGVFRVPTGCLSPGRDGRFSCPLGAFLVSLRGSPCPPVVSPGFLADAVALRWANFVTILIVDETRAREHIRHVVVVVIFNVLLVVDGDEHRLQRNHGRHRQYRLRVLPASPVVSHLHHCRNTNTDQ